MNFCVFFLALNLTSFQYIFFFWNPSSWLSSLFFGEVCPENFQEIPAKSAVFSANLCPKIPRNLTFFPANYQKPCPIYLFFLELSSWLSSLFFGEICPENSREIGRFLREFVSKNPAKFDFFSRELSEALQLKCKWTRGSNEHFWEQMDMCNLWRYSTFSVPTRQNGNYCFICTKIPVSSLLFLAMFCKFLIYQWDFKFATKGEKPFHLTRKISKISNQNFGWKVSQLQLCNLEWVVMLWVNLCWCEDQSRRWLKTKWQPCISPVPPLAIVQTYCPS